MNKKDIKFNKERKSFSKKIKREILLEAVKGKNIQKILYDVLPELLEVKSKDKKYASKLLYKWKKEIYSNREILFLLNHEFDKKMINNEILSLGDDNEEEINLNVVTKKIKSNFLKAIK